MRLICSFLLLITLPVVAWSQKETVSEDVKQAVRSLDQVYRLNADQKAKATDIQQDIQEHLETIKQLETQEYDLYLAKRSTIKNMGNTLLFRILNADQKKIYQQLKRKKKAAISKKKAELKRQGASMEDIERAILKMQ